VSHVSAQLTSRSFVAWVLVTTAASALGADSAVGGHGRGQRGGGQSLVARRQLARAIVAGGAAHGRIFGLRSPIDWSDPQRVLLDLPAFQRVAFSFDGDDNIAFFRRTKIHVFRRDRRSGRLLPRDALALDTHQFAALQEKIGDGQHPEVGEYHLDPTRSFRDFGDSPAPYNRFYSHLLRAQRGPSWRVLTDYALAEVPTALYTTINTTRKHAPQSIAAALRRYFERLNADPSRATAVRFGIPAGNVIPVMWAGWSGPEPPLVGDRPLHGSPAERKAQKEIAELVHLAAQPLPDAAVAVYGASGNDRDRRARHLKGFSDDSAGYLLEVHRQHAELMRRSPGLADRVAFSCFYHGPPDERLRFADGSYIAEDNAAHMLLPPAADGQLRFRPRLPKERGQAERIRSSWTDALHIELLTQFLDLADDQLPGNLPGGYPSPPLRRK
jgi:hypothetical protein